MVRNTDDFKKAIKKMYGNEYILKSNYVNTKTYVKMMHTKCNHTYNVTPSNFLKGKKCPFCSRKRPQRNTEWFKKMVKDKYGDEYTVLGEYIETHTPILMKHNKCNNIFEATPTNFLNKNKPTKCPKCSHRSYKKTNKEFKQEVTKLTNGEYEFVGNYINNKTPVEIKHKKCNRIFKVAPVDFLKPFGIRCQYCKESKGETKIRLFLEMNNIPFIAQYKIKDCKYKKELPFDFKIKYKDKFILLEYDGEQHYQPIFGSEKFIATQRNDKIKNEYCNKHKIKLIRISYKNIGKINRILSDLFK